MTFGDPDPQETPTQDAGRVASDDVVDALRRRYDDPRIQWRVGRKLGRTIYLGEHLQGLIDDEMTANHIVFALNTIPSILNRLTLAESRAVAAEKENVRMATCIGDAMTTLEKIPIIERPDAIQGPPFSICIGCGSKDDDPCEEDCWVVRLEIALYNCRRTLSEWNPSDATVAKIEGAVNG